MNFSMDIILLLIGLGGILFFCYKIIDKINNQLSDTINLNSQTVNESNMMVSKNSQTFLEELGKMEQKHWEQLEKQSSRQLQILEKQTKDFMSVMSDFIENSKPVPVVPDLLDKINVSENTIEKEEILEPNLQDISRIPLDGVNVQFEGEEEIHPIDIS